MSNHKVSDHDPNRLSTTPTQSQTCFNSFSSVRNVTNSGALILFSSKSSCVGSRNHDTAAVDSLTAPSIV